MFTVKAFHKNGSRDTYLCDVYTVSDKGNSIFIHRDTGDAVRLIIGEVYKSIYIENPSGKTIDAFKQE